MNTSTEWPATPRNGQQQAGSIQNFEASAESCTVQIRRRDHPTWKHMLDVAVVLVALPLLSPLLLAVALYIRLVSSGPVLFVQSRVGYGGEDFRIYKFRTMHSSQVCRDETHREFVASYTDDNGAMKKPDYQDQLIPGGSWLRKLSIDELPQLFNVLLGNMSLVGPRPDVLRLEDYRTRAVAAF